MHSNPKSLIFTTAFLLTISSFSHAITLPLVDDFEDGTVQGWGGSPTANTADVGPTGLGDDSLSVDVIKRFVTFNDSQWSGDWTAESVAQISLDVRHNNNFDLVLWLGISKGAPPLSFGAGDTYVSNQSHTVPGDDSWHTIVFDVLDSDFDVAPTSTAGAPDSAAALADVNQLRIIHSTTQSFIGEFASGSMLVDNITAIEIPEPSSLALAGVLFAFVLLPGRTRHT